MRLGGVEAGGTKMVFGIGDETGTVLEMKSVATTSPEETIPPILDYFLSQQVEAIGVGSFGPIQVDPDRPNYGAILNTPKTPWKGFEWPRAFAQVGCPVVIETDVNAAVLGEAMYGAAAGLSDCVYVTIGTGIGGGVLAGGNLVHGLLHPEIGHMLVRRNPQDSFAGGCPYHRDCLEGLASGPAVELRWGSKGSALEADHPAWDMEADYLAQMVVNLTLVLSTKRVILGGGVMHQAQLYDKVRDRVREYLAGYIELPSSANTNSSVNASLNGNALPKQHSPEKPSDAFIVPPGLGDLSGLVGALALAARSRIKPPH
ncbi:ROK family protein [Alicyclobacillus sp. ALC3]|uniref:ROK family protein n=1 Tax=Alicyclobacillus sp. ALC3 TaxID=2796143 RepID=UPI00237957DC|nr:ROK family protein [Alicyclobacillus sp. ALC3]WDL95384.1 ROK family protein [Alicyclobacillus sp. ALC3]